MTNMESTPLKTSTCTNGNGFHSYVVTPNDDIGDTTLYTAVPNTNGPETPNDASQTSSNGDTDEADKNTFSFSQMPRRSKYILLLCGFAQLCSGIAFAVIAPFYPHEAEKKGVSPTLVGLIFSVFELINFTMSPIIGKFLTRIGSKFALVSGLLVAGTSTILFGLLQYCPPGMTFFAMSMVCRVFIALGFVSFVVANFAIVCAEFPSNAAAVFGALESMTGIGLMIGPLFGSALYALGGFGIPFYCLGTLVIVSDALIYVFLPGSKVKKQTSSLSLTAFMKIPLVFMSLSNITISALSIGFLDATVAAHLENDFGLAVKLIGAVYFITPAMYGFSMPIVGYFVNEKNMRPIVLVGLLLTPSGFLVFAPCPWPGILPLKLWVVIPGLIMMGLGLGLVYMGATACILAAAKERGYQDDLDTFSLISGAHYFANCFGAFIGPFVGGALTQHIGDPAAYSVLAFMFLPSVLMSIVFYIYEHKKRKHKTEKILGDEGRLEKWEMSPTTKAKSP